MNDFQNIGIFLQLAAMIILLLKIASTFDCTGISGRTQLLYVLVFTTRFLDLPYEFSISLSSFIMKIIYLIVAYLTVIYIFVICRSSYQKEYDTFRFDLLVGACTMMALLSTYKKWHILTILWYFSLYLEAFAIFPQIQFTAKAGYVGSSLVFYVGMLACYRGFHLVHWAYLFLAENYIGNYFVVVAGTAQFLICCAYFAWMMPMYRGQYKHLKSAGSHADMAVVANEQLAGNDEGGKQQEA